MVHFPMPTNVNTFVSTVYSRIAILKSIFSGRSTSYCVHEVAQLAPMVILHLLVWN